MDILGKTDLDSQMIVLEGAALEEGAGNVNDEVEDLSNSLKEIVQDDTVKPKLHCLMMDQAFSMVTLQSEDSGILWETPSSRCSTPWASEIGDTSANLCTSLVPQGTQTSGLENAGNIIFVMDEDQMIRRKKRKRNKAVMKQPDDELVEPERPAMVEVSIPNVSTEKDPAEDQDRNQQLFCLVSEGSEILNIVVPPKVSTVDEEASQRLVDNLSYLEDTLIIKGSKIPEEPETSDEIQIENLEVAIPEEPESVYAPLQIQPAHNGATVEDYFEMFTLLDHQASGPSGATTIEGFQEPELVDHLLNDEDNAHDSKPGPEMIADSAPISRPDLTSEHVDEIFYGVVMDAEIQNKPRNGTHTKEDVPKCTLKKSGSALFGSQESILTPVYLPEGPKKIIDLVLLEEPKAMAFMYSDLYADALGSRLKQDDTESITSEKSFHSQESDIEDRGYLEKFVLKDETPQIEDPHPDHSQEVGVTMWSQSAFGLTRHVKDIVEVLTDEDEITDFFRNSANSSPCELYQEQKYIEQKELSQKSTSRRVLFQDEASKNDDRRTGAGNNITQPSEGIAEMAEAFSPLDTGVDSTTGEETSGAADYKSVIAEFAVKTAAPKPCKPAKPPRDKPPKVDPVLIRVPQTVKPITPQHKPFLDLTPLIPVETPEEAEGNEVDARDVEADVCPCIEKREEAKEEAQDYERTSTQEGSEPDLYGSAEGVPETVNTSLS